MSDSVQPHRRQPTRLPHPWDSLGKNTGVDCHFLHFVSRPQFAGWHPPYILQCPRTENTHLEQNFPWKKWCELVVLCVVSGLMSLGVVGDELLVLNSKHSVSLRKLPACAKNWLSWRENQHPKHLHRWVCKWNIIVFTGWAHCFCKQSPFGKLTTSIFLCSVPKMKIHTWNKLNFLQESGMTGLFSVCWLAYPYNTLWT